MCYEQPLSIYHFSLLELALENLNDHKALVVVLGTHLALDLLVSVLKWTSIFHMIIYTTIEANVEESLHISMPGST